MSDPWSTYDDGSHVIWEFHIKQKVSVDFFGCRESQWYGVGCDDTIDIIESSYWVDHICHRIGSTISVIVRVNMLATLMTYTSIMFYLLVTVYVSIWPQLLHARSMVVVSPQPHRDSNGEYEWPLHAQQSNLSWVQCSLPSILSRRLLIEVNLNSTSSSLVMISSDMMK